MPPVASTAAQAIFEGLHEDASRSRLGTDGRKAVYSSLAQCACCASVLDNMCVLGPGALIVTQPRCSCVNSGGCL